MFINKIFSLKLSHVLTLTSILTLASLLVYFQMSSRLLSVDYKVFGRVQGVFFRDFTRRKATELGLFGWVQNSRDGTVIGTIQGIEDQINIMKNWLESIGSPSSRIDRCEFSNQREITSYDFNQFHVRH